LSNSYGGAACHRKFGVVGVDKQRELISEVVMARMLMPFSAGALNAGRHASVAAHADPDHETLATSVAPSTRS
jgi:hypothetical protein